MTEKEKQVAHFKSKIIISSLIILLVGALIYIVGGAEFNNVNFFACLGKLYIQSADTSVYMTLMGLMGGLIGYPLLCFAARLRHFACVLLQPLCLYLL